MEKLRAPFAEVLANRRTGPHSRRASHRHRGAWSLAASVRPCSGRPNDPAAALSRYRLDPRPAAVRCTRWKIYPLVSQMHRPCSRRLALRSGSASTGVYRRERRIT